MSLTICPLHNQLTDYICAKDSDNQLLCRQCFLSHSQKTGHHMSVRLSIDSKYFFLRWTEYVLKKMIEFKQIVSQMGYSKVFEMRLQPNHPKASVNELNFQDIQKVAMQVLQEHRVITEGNLTFIQGTVTIVQMMMPEFLKDLYNIVCENTEFNLSNMLIQFKKKLIANYPQKGIYEYATFVIVQKQLMAMQQTRRQLLSEYEGRIVLRGEGAKLGKVTDKEMQKDYQSPAYSSSILIGEVNDVNIENENKQRQDRQLNQQQKQQSLRSQQQQQQQPIQHQPCSPTNISTISNPSKSITQQPKQMQYSKHNIITDTISEPVIKEKILQSSQNVNFSYQKMTTTIALLRENQNMYQDKIVRLQQKNLLLASEVERLLGYQNKVKLLQNQLQQVQKVIVNANNKPQQQQQQLYSKQIQQLTAAQSNLIQQNTKLNHTLKDFQDIAQGRLRTINDLQQQIKTLTNNLQLKQKSIQQLNMLISNQQQQITYRQNEVDILGQQIKKKLQRIAFLQKSIEEHDKLVSNQEQQLTYRENQVQQLNQQIQKLKEQNTQLLQSIKSLNSLITNQQQQLTYRENQVQTLQQKINKLLTKIAQLQKTIKQLNLILGNQEQEIAYRENQVGTLNKNVTKLVEKNKFLIQQLKEIKEKYIVVESQLKAYVGKQTQNQIQLKALTNNYALLKTECDILKSQLLNTKAQLALSQQQFQKQDFNQKLAAQVIELESQLHNKINDFKMLAQLAQDCTKYMSNQQVAKINQKLSKSLLSKD